MDQRDLRTSDRERLGVAERLQAAMAEGFLSTVEFDERTAEVLASRTRGELADLTADLPHQMRFDPDYDMLPARPAGGVDEPVVMEHSLETIKHGAGWSPPPHMVVKSWGGTAVLDFAAADLVLPRYRITLDVKGGTARLYLPDGAGLQLSGAISGSSGVKDRRRVTVRDPAQPLFEIDGSMTWSTLKIMGPRRGWWDA